MAKFYVLHDVDHVCIGKEMAIRQIEDHKPLLFYENELEQFQILLLEGLKKDTYSAKMDRKIGPVRIEKQNHRWELHGKNGCYRATTSEIKELLSELIKPGITVQRKNKRKISVVIGAPHAGFDLGTGELAGKVAGKIHTGCVIAHHFRYPPEHNRPEIMPLYINVNRPTEGQYKDGILKKEWVTSRAGQIYMEYQQALFKAGSNNKPPLDLLIEFHAHARDNAIQVATSHIPHRTADLICSEWERITASQAEFPAYPLKVEPLHDVYWKASMAKKFGAFRKEMTSAGMHLEIPYPLLKKTGIKQMAGVLIEWLDYVISIFEQSTYHGKRG
ncbi:MAG: hypothetical protein Kow00108_10560 [Calditrichia bacterium]